ncbi:MAG TPA: carboxypeptidase-like regulatory domain-containing protein [Paludibaculum sp.]|jgi:hypothetical protein
MFRFGLALLLAFVLPAATQQGRGSILGSVTDGTGAAVPAASVRILNTATNEEGFFNAPSLPVGAYSVTVERAGFKKAVRSGITLQVDELGPGPRSASALPISVRRTITHNPSQVCGPGRLSHDHHHDACRHRREEPESAR